MVKGKRKCERDVKRAGRHKNGNEEDKIRDVNIKT